MIKRLALAVVAILQISSLAQAAPDALEALEHFKDYQQEQRRGRPTQRLLSKIHEALEINPLFYTKETSSDPILVLVAYSHLSHRPSEKPFTMVLDEVLSLLPTGNFERRLYQLNDLHSNQARQSIWQLRDEDTVMRIEVVPGASIAITFFSAHDAHAAQHATRRALMLTRNKIFRNTSVNRPQRTDNSIDENSYFIKYALHC